MEIVNCCAVEFTEEVLRFLQLEGYTYVWCYGIYEQSNRYDEVYHLYPLKKNDGMLALKHSVNLMITRLSDCAIKEMVAGDEFITFLIHLPKEVYRKFINSEKFSN